MGELRYGVAHLVVPNDVGEAVERAPGLVGNSCGVARIGEPLASSPRYLRSGQPLTHHGSGEEVLLHEARERFADLVLLAGMIAVCGIGIPNGYRNKAVTANQSASPPTMDASAAACRYPHSPCRSPKITHTANTPAAATSIPVATSFMRRSACIRSSASIGTVTDGSCQPSRRATAAATRPADPVSKPRNSDGSTSSTSTTAGPAKAGSRSTLV